MMKIMFNLFCGKIRVTTIIFSADIGPLQPKIVLVALSKSERINCLTVVSLMERKGFLEQIMILHIRSTWIHSFFSNVF